MLYLVNGEYDREFYSKQVNRITENIRNMVLKNTGKKPYEQKLNEVRKVIFSQDQINLVLKEQLKERCFENSQFCVFIGLVILRAINEGDYDSIVPNFLDIIHKDTEKLLNDNEDEEK